MAALTLHPMKEIRVIVSGEHRPFVTELLDKVEATGYTIIGNISGKGHHGVQRECGHVSTPLKKRGLSRGTAGCNLCVTGIPHAAPDPRGHVAVPDAVFRVQRSQVHPLVVIEMLQHLVPRNEFLDPRA